MSEAVKYRFVWKDGYVDSCLMNTKDSFCFRWHYNLDEKECYKIMENLLSYGSLEVYEFYKVIYKDGSVEFIEK